MVWSNRKRFNQLDYSSDSPVVKESFIQWLPLPRSQKTYNMNIKFAELEREDSLMMAINGVTTQNEPFFHIMRTDFGDRCMNYHDRINLMFHIDHEVTLIQRQVYNSFMLFGDVGGFSGLLIGLGSLIVSFLNFQNAENYVAQFLYKSKSKGDERLDPRQ